MGIVIIKAAISVFICCLIYLFFGIGTGAPFYSAIAAVICIQPEIRSTFRIGLNRTVGTLIGGFTGMFILFLLRGMSLEAHSALASLLISACIIPLMYLAEIVKKKPLPHFIDNPEHKTPLAMAPFRIFIDFMRKNALTNITCIAFLSVTITHGSDESITGFALNRMLDTLIGVFVSFFINIIPFFHTDRMKEETQQAATTATYGCQRCCQTISTPSSRDSRSRYMKLAILSRRAIRSAKPRKKPSAENRDHSIADTDNTA